MARTRLRSVAILLALLAIASPASADLQYTFTPAGPTGVFNFFANGINNNGDIAGYSIAGSNNGEVFTSYVSCTFCETFTVRHCGVSRGRRTPGFLALTAAPQ